jgi:hypothetical protein
MSTASERRHRPRWTSPSTSPCSPARTNVKEDVAKVLYLEKRKVEDATASSQ